MINMRLFDLLVIGFTIIKSDHFVSTNQKFAFSWHLWLFCDPSLHRFWALTLFYTVSTFKGLWLLPLNTFCIVSTISYIRHPFWLKLEFNLRGISVLNNKTELEKAFAKHKKNLEEKQKEQERTEQGLGTEFNKILADRAKRLEQLEQKVVLSSVFYELRQFCNLCLPCRVIIMLRKRKQLLQLPTTSLLNKARIKPLIPTSI